MAHGDGIYKRPDYETFWITYKNADGQRVRENAKTTDRGIAKRIRDERVGRVARGEHLDPRRDQTTYEQAREDLLTYYRVNGTRDVAEAGGRLAHLDPYFAGRAIAKIDAGAVEEYVRHRQKASAANGTINRELATLSKMLRLAHERDKLARVPVLTKTREADPRSGFVTRQEFDSIVQHLPEELQAGALIAFTLGWRKAEVFGLQLRHLDLEAGTVRLDPGTTKNRQGRLGAPHPRAEGRADRPGGPCEGPGSAGSSPTCSRTSRGGILASPWLIYGRHGGAPAGRRVGRVSCSTICGGVP